MKPYEKPRLIALSLSGNEQLCGSCADAQKNKPGITGHLLYQDPSGPIARQVDIAAGNGIPPLTRDEAIHAFADGEQGCTRPVGVYCKFTATEDMLVAWS